MNQSLANAAENAIRHGDYETGKGFCLRFTRQCAEATPGIGEKYDRLFRGDGSERDATAARAGHRFLAAGLAFRRDELAAHGGLQPGDMPVKTNVAPNRWGDFSGHIGVVTPDAKHIAENSSTHTGRVRGALGFRTIEQFGDYQIVIRLPDPNIKIAPVLAPIEPAIIIVSDKPRRVKTILRDGVNFAPVREVLTAAGIGFADGDAWSDGTPALYIKG